MRKFLSLFLVSIMLSMLLSTTTSADNSKICVNVDDYPVEFDAEPYLQNGCVMVPIRTISEEFGATVVWDNHKKTITATYKNITTVLTIHSSTAKVDGEDVTLDAPAEIKNGRTFVPVRFFSEAFGANVEWDSDTKTVNIWFQVIPSKYYLGKELSILDGRAYLTLPNETFSEEKEFFLGLLNDDPSTLNFDLHSEIGSDQIFFYASDTYTYTTDDLLEVAKTDDLLGILEIKNKKNAKIYTTESGLDILLMIDWNAPIIHRGGSFMEVIIKHSDNTLIELGVTSNMDISNKSNNSKIEQYIMKMLDTLRLGKKLDFPKRQEKLMNQYTIDLEQGYVKNDEYTGPDSSCIITKLTKVGEKRPWMHIWYDSPDDSRNPSNKTSGVILNKAIEWQYYGENPEDPDYWVTTTVPLENSPDLVIQINPSNKENLEELMKIAYSLKELP